MKSAREFLVNALVGGVLILLPLYLAVLLLVKGMKSVAGLVRPIAMLLPASFPFENLLALAVILIACVVVGAIVRTAAGRALRDRVEHSLFGNVPGYEMFAALMRRLTGRADDDAWQPALVELEEALVPAFIVERLTDGRFTIFVPSVPTPFAGAIYILTADRVHLVDVPFAKAFKSVARWGIGTKDLVAAMRRDDPARS